MGMTKQAEGLCSYIQDGRRLESLREQLADKQRMFKEVGILCKVEDACEEHVELYNKLNLKILVDMLAINEVEKRCLEYELQRAMED